VATLTPRGLREREILDRRSDELALQTLAPLDPPQRQRLVEAMQTVARLLTAAKVEIRELDANHPDARQCLRAYFSELDRRSYSGFDPEAGVPADPHEMRPPAGSFLVAYLRQEPIGCGGVRHHPGEASEIKRMWVSGTARGLGLGRRLLAELEARAVAAEEARRRKHACREISPGAANWPNDHCRGRARRPEPPGAP
jgi:GNAT superfamily N-acetyltransferase